MPEVPLDDSQSEAPPTARKVVRLGEGDAPMYYVNNTEIGVTTWDVNLRFARIEKLDAESLFVRDQAIVTMSLQHAKTVMMILAGYIEEYEKVNGPLATPIKQLQAGGRAEVDIATAMFPEAEAADQIKK